MSILLLLTRLSHGDALAQEVSKSLLVGVCGRLAACPWAPQDSREDEKMLELVLLFSLGTLLLIGHCISSANHTGFRCDGTEEGFNSFWWKESPSASSPNSKTTSRGPPSNSPCLYLIPTAYQFPGVKNERRLPNLIIPYTVWITLWISSQKLWWNRCCLKCYLMK